MESQFSKTRKIAISAIIAALYIVIMQFTQPISFGSFQIRIATALYALGYLFPFITIPMGLANAFANSLGPLGLPDIIGGLFIGMIVPGACALVRRFNLSPLFVIPIVIFAPGLIVPLWLAPIFGLPYWLVVFRLCIGQAVPAVVGYLLVRTLAKTNIHMQ